LKNKKSLKQYGPEASETEAEAWSVKLSLKLEAWSLRREAWSLKPEAW